MRMEYIGTAKRLWSGSKKFPILLVLAYICTAMRVFRDLNQLPAFKNAVITIGSFDGIHLGHQSIIQQLKQLAREVNGESVLLTFYPHPRQVVYPSDDTLKLLCSQREKIQLLDRFGLDNLVIIPFTVEFSQLTADEYIEKLLVEKFQPKYIVIGYDHRFGTGRQGDVSYLNWYADKAGFQLEVIEKQEADDMVISSTKIRQAIEAGNIEQANLLLGHPYPLSGKVVSGESLGRKMGFPTANLELEEANKLLPPNAIYAVWVVHEGVRYGGMLYIGDRPSLKHLTNKTIEVNIFDFNRDIYGDQLDLELVSFLRQDIQFDSLTELQDQLAKDETTARQALEQAEKKKRLQAASYGNSHSQL